jgi:putative hydrolase of the HAD superfamily
MFTWTEIDTVLLDMDGTILDLHFDNHFWLEHLPKRYAEMANISDEQASNRLTKLYQQVSGTISWYCLDYWQEKLQLPIVELKKEIQHLIELRADAKEFLEALKQSNKRVILVTNAHPDSLSLKIERTALDQYFDQLISTHSFGVSKESQQLWQQLAASLRLDKNKTLFIDDSLEILKAAQTFGINHLLAVANPDSKQASRTIDDFKAIDNFAPLAAEFLRQQKLSAAERK